MTRAAPLPTVPAMVGNILDIYMRATQAQRVAGRDWYRAAGSIVQAIADYTDVDTPRVAHALSALSPRNPWRWNVQDAYAYCRAATSGGTMPNATTFKRNSHAAWRILTGDDLQPWLGAAPKVRAFVGAIMGDTEAVVVDTWAIRVATDGVKSALTDRQYGDVAEAYRLAGKLAKEYPTSIQAITWLVAQDEGLASKRRGRHDRACKAGTSAFVHGLFEPKGE